MWKHLPPFGHRRTNSKRGKNRDRNPRPRASTALTGDERSNSIPRPLVSAPPPPQSQPQPPSHPAPPPALARIPYQPQPLGPGSGPSTHKLMTAATFDHPQQTQPPTKASLKTWWNHFTFAQKAKREADEKSRGLAFGATGTGNVFGKPLQESLRYANVQISTANANGELYVWGYIPVVVAKCGLYLKENATEIEGTFRVNGSNKRMRDLQAAFETPPRYGKDLDWKNEHYTAHDAASVFRRFLTQMPEPVIPHDMYQHFRDVVVRKPFNRDEAIARFKRLIRSLPRANQYLLLYVLDLLSVFARKSEKNLMTAKNLAVIFRPALLSHPTHELSPQEHQLSQDVLEFLIETQDWFMLDITPPGSASRSGSGAAPPPNVEPVDMVISEDADTLDWALVDKEGGVRNGSRRIVRRRTTSERPGDTIARTKIEHDDLSPVLETPPSRGESVVTVTRSRTMPSKAHRDRDHHPHHRDRHRGGGSENENGSGEQDAAVEAGVAAHPKVLKKQKRVSAQPAPRPGAGS